MNTKKTLIILLIMTLFLSLAEVCLFLTSPSRHLSENEPEAVPVLLTDYTGTDQIALINVENADGSYLVMNRPGQGYLISSFEDGSVDQNETDQLFQLVMHMEADEIVAENADREQLEAFGLNDPACSLLYMDLQKQGFSLLIGNEIPQKDACYALIEGNPNVYAIPLSTAERLQLSVSAYLDLRLLPELSGLSAADITDVTLEKEERPVFSLERYRVSEYGNAAFYRLTLPVTLYPDWDILQPLLLDPLCGLRAESLTDRQPGTDPDYRISLTAGDMHMQLSFFCDPDGNCIIKKDGNAALYQISTDQLSFLTLDASALLGGTLLRESAASLEEILISTPDGNTTTYQIQPSGSDWNAVQNGVMMKQEDFFSVLTALNHLYISSAVSPSRAEEAQNAAGGTPYLSLTVTYREDTGKQPVHMQFRETGDRSVTVSVNGIPGFELYKTTVDSFIEETCL